MISKAPRTSIDLSHHLNHVSRSRRPSPLKDIVKYMAADGMVSLAGGLPHPSLFPFANITVEVYPPSTVLDPLQPIKPITPLDHLIIPRVSGESDQLDLTTALQYDSGPGALSLRTWATEFTRSVFQPAYDDWDVILNSGNTDGWSKVVRLLCEPGDYILCEEQTYPSAQAVWAPMGCKALPIQLDAEGIRADDLEDCLSIWEISHPGVARPRLLYLVPVGSNPTGSTMGAQRKQDIYNVCVKHDVIICEDDPYYFLQFPDSQATHNNEVAPPIASAAWISAQIYLQSLAPSFLKFDYQGRVIRLETFSKTLAPGNRVGFFIANPTFIERLLRATEVETQAPSGWATVILSNLLHKWGIDGYLQWLAQLRDQYHTRRDWMCSAIAASFELHAARQLSEQSPGADTITITHPNGAEMFSFQPPRAGMFLWARLYFYNSPRFQRLQDAGESLDPEREFQDELWLALATNSVLVTPGSYYTPWEGSEKLSTQSRNAEKGIGYFRLSFSMTTKDDMESGIRRMGEVMRRFWA